MTPQGVGAATKRSKRNKTRAKSIKSINSIDYVGVLLQSVVTYTYIGSRM
jgi:hypothetical protein